MPKQVRVFEGNEKKISQEMFKLFTRYVQAVQRARLTGRGDDKRNMMAVEERCKDFFKNPLIELPEINTEE